MSDAIELEQLFDAAGDGIVVAAADGTILRWNPGAERIFGFTRAEAVGQSLDIIIPERFRDRHWEGYRTAMRDGRTRYASEVLRVPALHKDGRRLSIGFTVALLRSADGETAIAAFVRDETERWQAERAREQRIAELEAALKRATG